jgi:hypothetical protein
MIGTIISWLIGGGVQGLAGEWRRVKEAQIKAESETEMLEHGRELSRIEGQMEIARIEANDRFSATRIGRLLIVVPYGIWWAAVILVSTFGVGDQLVIQDLPPRIHDMANILIPAIVLGSVLERFRK